MKSDSYQRSSGAKLDEPIKLASDQGVTLTIEARPPRNRTNILLEPDAVYSLEATGKWFDAGREAGPDGYEYGNFFQNAVWWLRRSPNVNWFALLGTAEPEQAPFLIGKHAIYQARRVGDYENQRRTMILWL
jgi:hypothetical protein